MLSPQQIDAQWEVLLKYVSQLKTPRANQLKKLYLDFEGVMKYAPASSKKEYHSCFEGGYVYHVLNVIKAAGEFNLVWKNLGVMPTYSDEELLFSCLNHDLGKVGEKDTPYYIPNSSEWHKKNLGQLYTVNPNLGFMAVHHRSLFLLQQYNIPVSYNENIAILTHGGLYDEGNKEYLMGYSKPISSMLHIMHQADLCAARLEFEEQTLSKKTPKEVVNDSITTPKSSSKKDIQKKIMDEKDPSALKYIFKSFTS